MTTWLLKIQGVLLTGQPHPHQPAQGSPVWLALSGHWLQGRGSWKELKKYHMTQAMMVL